MFGGDQILYILIYAVYLIVQFGAGIHILFTKHEEPSSALLWLLVITILPVVGLMLGGIALVIILGHAITFAGFAAIMERSAVRALNFRQLLNIAIYAATPATLVSAAFIALELESVNLWWLYLIVYGLYLIGGVAASREPAPVDVTGSDDSA